MVREILTFEVMSSKEWAILGTAPFVPSVFMNITDYLPKKLKALLAYDIEMRPAPHSRIITHIESLSRHRVNSVGLNTAKGFGLIGLLA
jgi:hypothetical protein